MFLLLLIKQLKSKNILIKDLYQSPFSINSNFLSVKFLHCFEHCHDILRWNVRHDIVNRIEHIPPTRTENIKVVSHMIFNQLGSGTVQDTLRIATSAPECNLTAEFFFQSFRFHIDCIDLNRIKYFKTCFNQLRDKFIYRSEEH